MLVRIISGTYGYIPTLINGEKSPYVVNVTRGDLPIDLDEDEAKRLVKEGVAEYVDGEAVATATVPFEDADPNGNMPEEENAPESQETAENGEDVDLDDMTFAELKAYAQEIGIENVGKYRSKAALIEAINGIGDELPDLTPQDVVEE